MAFFVTSGTTLSKPKQMLANPRARASGKTPSRKVMEEARINKRKVVVFSSLLVVLGLTSFLFILIAPPPLAPGAVGSLYALDNPATAETLFDTRTPVVPNRWRYIYIHQSHSPVGDVSAVTKGGDGMVDHFVISNGDGGAEGELLIGPRWNEQRGAGAPMGSPAGSVMDAACISICLAGDFDQTTPNPMQYARLTQLVRVLQGRCQVSSGNVVLSVGNYFPASDFQKLLLPSRAAK